VAQKRFTLSLGKTEATHVLEAIVQTAARQKATLGITNEPLNKVAVRLSAALAEPDEPKKKEPEDDVDTLDPDA
jgi:hypothetical protein